MAGVLPGRALRVSPVSMYGGFAVLTLLLTTAAPATLAQSQRTGTTVPVEGVATASEYVPRSVTVSHPGHSVSDCSGSTSYFGQFYGNSVSGTADTSTSCSTTSYPPTESTYTVYRRWNYTIVKSEHALYLLSCTQIWPWSKCPSFGIGTKYFLTVEARKQDVLLDDASGSKPIKLNYMSSVAVPATSAQPSSSPAAQSQAVGTSEEARVHITSTPSGGEIYADGKFVGNAPSDIALPAGEHALKVLLDGREWSRSIQISSGDVSVHAEIPTESAGGSTEPAGDRWGTSQPAVESLRDLAQHIKQCPANGPGPTKWGKGATETYQVLVGPPENVIWNVEPSRSARSPYSGYIEFLVRLQLVVPPESFEKFTRKMSGMWESFQQQQPDEYRYEFDVGPNGLQLTRVFSRRANETEWKPDQLPGWCWGKVVSSQVAVAH